jgi:hypothetical protein
MDAQDLQQIVELCDEALHEMKLYDTRIDADSTTHSQKLLNIISTLLDGKSLTPELRKLISVKDQGALTTATMNLGFDMWHTGQLFAQHSGKVVAVRNILQSNIDRLNSMKTSVPHVVFYSWQSDLPNNTNRGFIEQAIEVAIKKVAADGQVEPRIDQGAMDTAGSQSLHATILRKIESCGVFVADVSLVSGQGGRHCNSNVMYELGYATNCLGEDRVLLICNTEYGEIEDLPFDIKHKYVLAYKLSAGDEKAKARERLAAMIEDKIRPIFKK